MFLANGGAPLGTAITSAAGTGFRVFASRTVPILAVSVWPIAAGYTPVYPPAFRITTSASNSSQLAVAQSNRTPLLGRSPHTLARWADALILVKPDLVKPDTVVRWHRAGFRLYSRFRTRLGRRKLDPAVREVLKRMAAENPSWVRPAFMASS